MHFDVLYWFMVLILSETSPRSQAQEQYHGHTVAPSEAGLWSVLATPTALANTKGVVPGVENLQVRKVGNGGMGWFLYNSIL